jgi:tRNA-2-methylthio-N6-dimethylallyladenosine synthase
MDYVKYDFSYMFFYSERPGTLAAKKYVDDIPLETKKKRLNEIIDKQRAISLTRNQRDVGKTFKVLVEGVSKKSEAELQGRNSANKVIVFPRHQFKKSEYVNVKVTHCTGATLIGEPVIAL